MKNRWTGLDVELIWVIFTSTDIGLRGHLVLLLLWNRTRSTKSRRSNNIL